MSDRQPHQVFISCPSHKGALLSAVVDLLASRLEEKGICYWVRHRDLDKNSGKNERTMIEEAIRSSEVFIPVLDGRTKGKTAAETNWQIEEAIANDLAIVPFSLRKPAAEKGRSGNEGGDWFDDLENVLDERFDILVRKVQSLIEEPPAVEAKEIKVEEDEVKDAEAGENEDGDTEDVEGDEDEDEEEEEEEEEIEGEADEAGDDEEGIEAGGVAESEEEVSAKEKEEIEALDDNDDDKVRRRRITFPLPPPTVMVRKVRRTRKPGVAHEKLEDAEIDENGAADIDDSRKQETKAEEADPVPEHGEAAAAAADVEDHEAARKPRNFRKMAPLLACSITLLALLIGVQAVSTRRDMTAQQRNLLELELLGFSLNMYASEHEGRLPDSLDELKGKRSSGSALRWRDYETLTEEEFIYWPGFSWKYKPVAVIAAAPRPDPDGKRAVLYLNAEVRRMPESLFQRRLKAGSIGPPKPAPELPADPPAGTEAGAALQTEKMAIFQKSAF